MRERRSFIKGLLAVLGGVALNEAPVRCYGRNEKPIGNRPPAPEPPPRPGNPNTGVAVSRYPAPQGCPGVKYFRVDEYSLPLNLKCYLDDLDVTCAAFESDSKAGWVKMYAVRYEQALEGKMNEPLQSINNDPRGYQRVIVKYGKVEYRP